MFFGLGLESDYFLLSISQEFLPRLQVATTRCDLEHKAPRQPQPSAGRRTIDDEDEGVEKTLNIDIIGS